MQISFNIIAGVTATLLLCTATKNMSIGDKSKNITIIETASERHINPTTIIASEENKRNLTKHPVCELFLVSMVLWPSESSNTELADAAYALCLHPLSEADDVEVLVADLVMHFMSITYPDEGVNWVLFGCVVAVVVFLPLVVATVCSVLRQGTTYECQLKCADTRCFIPIGLSFTYDVFISNCAQDEPLVLDVILPELERSYSVCVGSRDWAPGSWPPTETSRSVQSSRRTLLLLSSAFLRGVWSDTELRLAHLRAFDGPLSRVIILLLDPIDAVDAEACGVELTSYLARGRYVKWGDPLLWETLAYHLCSRQVFVPSGRLSNSDDDRSDDEVTVM